MKELKKKRIQRPENLNARIAKTKRDARERIISRGKVEFRLDKTVMRELLEKADEVKVPYGVYARMLMIQSLRRDS